MEFLDYKGHSIVISQIVGVSKVKPYPYQSNNQFGFEINTTGHDYLIYVFSDLTADSNHRHSESDRLAKAQQERLRLLEILKHL